MDEMKWAWVLFVAASLAVLIRMALWFLPSPAIRHAEQVMAAVDPAPADPVEEDEVDWAPPPPPTQDPAWPDEPATALDWPPAQPPEWMSPPEQPRDPGPPPEEFFFRRTRWGMTLEEVRAAEAGEPMRESERGLLYVTTTLDLPSLLTYSFVQNRLVRARLSFSDPTAQLIPPLSMAQAQQRFLFLREQLRMRYGEPIEETTHLPRDVSALQRSADKQDELARQYDVEIAEAQERIRRQRAILEARYERWRNRSEMVARGLAPYERDLRELREWKREALDLAAQSRRSIQAHRQADSATPLVATMAARWPYARELHDIELRLDFRYPTPLLDIRYEATRFLPDYRHMDEL